MLAIAAGPIQAAWIADPTAQLGQYLTLWLGVALFSAAICYGDVWLRLSAVIWAAA